ncbi:12220_t:CDS:2 [Funneliformis geosporum]|uniref:12220_t:CDS:1 n=1 Tax=Funneliformis geosporum TaxID=1117311 RepID=A0A9W4SLG5_9GLOM|nr:12220_t:CDS:2 [Funneliformis geosporum]
MNFLTSIQKGIAEERPELVPTKVCQEKAKQEGLICGGVAAILSVSSYIYPLTNILNLVTSIAAGYVISRSSFNNCLLDVQLKQQRIEAATKSESDITANQELQSKESVFIDPYNTTEGDN